MKLKITHIITGLGTGGAEMMLYKLLQHTNQAQFKSDVISLTGEGPHAKSISEMGFSVKCLKLRPGVSLFTGAIKFWLHLRKTKPDIIQTWLYHADLLGGIIGRCVGVDYICWGVRSSNLDSDKIKWTTLVVVKLCARLSKTVPNLIVCNSRKAKKYHQAIGYDMTKFFWIPNGFDTDLFYPNHRYRNQFRQKLGIKTSDFVIVHVGRYDLFKNHSGLLKAYAYTRKRFSNVHLICCGDEVNSQNLTLTKLIRELGIWIRLKGLLISGLFWMKLIRQLLFNRSLGGSILLQ